MIQPLHCPVCEKKLPARAEAGVSSFPFCSDRCRKVDLLRWCDGRYAIVEDIDPQVAQFLKENPSLPGPGEGNAVSD